MRVGDSQLVQAGAVKFLHCLIDISSETGKGVAILSLLREKSKTLVSRIVASNEIRGDTGFTSDMALVDVNVTLTVCD